MNNYREINEFTSELLLKKIYEDVIFIRRKLFNTDNAPFIDVVSAVKWIEATANKPLTIEMEQIKKNTLRINKEIKELIKDQKCNISYKLYHIMLPYYKNDCDCVTRVIATYSEKLSFLAVESKKIHKATDFNWAYIVIYILCDEKPFLPRISISSAMSANVLPTGIQLKKGYIHITIRAKDLTFKDLQYIYKTYRNDCYTKKGEKHISLEQIRVYNLVKKAGKPPTAQGRKQGTKKDGSYTQYWNKIIDMYKEEYGYCQPNIKRIVDLYYRANNKTENILLID